MINVLVGYLGSILKKGPIQTKIIQLKGGLDHKMRFRDLPEPVRKKLKHDFIERQNKGPYSSWYENWKHTNYTEKESGDLYGPFTWLILVHRDCKLRFEYFGMMGGNCAMNEKDAFNSYQLNRRFSCFFGLSVKQTNEPTPKMTWISWQGRPPNLRSKLTSFSTSFSFEWFRFGAGFGWSAHAAHPFIIHEIFGIRQTSIFPLNILIKMTPRNLWHS